MKAMSVARPLANSLPLNSRAVVVLTGLSYLFVGFGFSFLDRRYDFFGVEALLWAAWAILGFGAGAFNIGKPGNAGQTQWLVFGLLGGVLALVPGFAMFNLLRWMCLTLMIVIGARAAVLKTRRDFYMTLSVVFVVSFMVGTHGSADWTLWFYLGPAWLFAGLALAWDHASGTALSRWIKIVMTTSFIALSFLLAFALFFFAPRPPILGFGFLPPGADTPGMFKLPAGGDEVGGKSGNSAGSGLGGTSTAQQNSAGSPWDAMLKAMRKSAGDKSIPQWQRSMMGSALDWAQALHGRLTGQLGASPDDPSSTNALGDFSESFEQFKRLVFELNWLLILALLLASYLLWRNRYRLGLQLVLGGAWLLSKSYPQQSMRLSAQAMKWCLHQRGYKRRPYHSVREHLQSATNMPPLAKRWFGYAMESYCSMRFDALPATPQQAVNMRRAVWGACEIVMGKAPELTK